MHRSTPIICAMCLLILLSACGVKRVPVPDGRLEEGTVGYYSSIRFYGDSSPKDIGEAMLDWSHQDRTVEDRDRLTFLSLSGGGADGAFGAGFLSGWSARGDRPTFSVVTGVSTGALIAPYAFLGSGYDRVIEHFYTTYSTSDLVVPKPIGTAMMGDSVMSTDPMRQVLKDSITADIIRKIAREHKTGRRLFIGTTNLDAMRPVYWNIGAIALYDTEEAFQLIRDVILASASVPVAFPPVYFKVRSGGVEYDEMHVDGGVTNQVFSYPPSIKLDEEMQKLGDNRPIELYVIRNGLLNSRPEEVEPTLLNIAERSLSALTQNQGIGDIYRIYTTATRDGLDFNLAFIPPAFKEDGSEELFHTPYMKKLFKVGYALGRSDDPWHKKPPMERAPQ